MDEFSGVLLVNKKENMTSHDVVNKIRRIYQTKKVGHTGTLDPNARGVLVMLIGRATKASEYIKSDSKRYIAELKLGIETTTEDVWGEITNEYNGKMPTFEMVKKVCESFEGTSYQVPPMYSAIKVNGKKLVNLARKNIEIEREKRPINVNVISILPAKEENTYTLDVRVSSGTYIRTLCSDIGKKLGCGGVMSSLNRIETGPFKIEDAYSLEQLEEMTEEQRINILIKEENLFLSYPEVNLPDFFYHLASCGVEIYQKKISSNFDDGTLVRFKHQGNFFALGKVMEFEEGSAIKPIKQFVLNKKDNE